MKMNRREAMALGAASVASMSLSSRAGAETVSSIVQAHDKGLKQALGGQVTDRQSPWCGAVPDASGLHHCSSAAYLLREGTAALFHPQSAFCGSKELRGKLELAIDFLMRFQNADGNIDLLSTNFNSPPDTGFVVHNVGTAAKLAQMNSDMSLLSQIEPFLRQAGGGMAKGGIHTPNHRWVVCAAMAQIHDLFPDKRYPARIGQWLAEGIDIDEEGQYTERSTAGYNGIVNHSFVVLAHKLNRPELMDPVRKNLEAMAYLLHANGEVVTEISHRQDLNTRRTMRAYWFALRYMAIRDGNGLYASMLAPLEPEGIELAKLMEYPELQNDLPAPTPIPDAYEKHYPISGISRVRRGKTSVTIMHTKNSRWVSMRHGGAVINAVRFASAFFGKGQFIPEEFEKRQDGYHFRQELEGWYYQPLSDPKLLPVDHKAWGRLKWKREKTEKCHLVYDGHIKDTPQGFEISIHAHGTDNIPFALEINLREGGELSGATASPRIGDAFLLKDGFAEYRVDEHTIRFGPGHCQHAYTQVRGAQNKLPGPSVYLTGYTPFQHTLAFQML